MYLIEWSLWFSVVKPDSWMKKHFEQSRNELIFEDTAESIEQSLIKTKTPFKGIDSPGSVYRYNGDFIEVRSGGLENKRGLITILTAIWLGMVCFLLSFIVIGFVYHGVKLGSLIVSTIFLSIGVVILYFYIKYGLRISRLELFTTRHLITRFNRKTRQVYLHRPKQCGGIAVLPWQYVTVQFMSPLPTALAWHPYKNNLPCPYGAFIGHATPSIVKQKAQWEFIRRYMEGEPLENLPEVRLTSHFPWPWQAFAAQFEGLGRFFDKASVWGWLGALLISPAFLIIGLAHWVSLLLCWKPRWPKIIEEAGQPGKPVPKITSLEDYPPDIQDALRATAYRWEVKSE